MTNVTSPVALIGLVGGVVLALVAAHYVGKAVERAMWQRHVSQPESRDRSETAGVAATLLTAIILLWGLTQIGF